jgi:hypothetical protein
MTGRPREQREWLWVPVIAPVVWACHFEICYVLGALSCGRFTHLGRGAVAEIAVATAIAALLIAACFARGWQRHGYELAIGPNDDDSAADRQRFVAVMTMLLAGLSLLGTLFVGVGAMLVEPCAR